MRSRLRTYHVCFAASVTARVLSGLAADVGMAHSSKALLIVALMLFPLAVYLWLESQ